MRLTKATDLALRIAMRLAVLDENESPRTRDVAASLVVPYSHAAKVVTRLQHLGVLEARRGRSGGLTLTQAGRTGSLGRLVRLLEGEGDVAGCDEKTLCPLRSTCHLRGALRVAREAFYSALDPLTIEQLTAGPSAARATLIALSPSS